jgi:hypothetical protein
LKQVGFAVKHLKHQPGIFLLRIIITSFCSTRVVILFLLLITEAQESAVPVPLSNIGSGADYDYMVLLLIQVIRSKNRISAFHFKISWSTPFVILLDNRPVFLSVIH